MIDVVGEDERGGLTGRGFAALLATLFGGAAAFACLGGWVGIAGIAVVMVGVVIVSLATM
ncbi:hypothetical protein [Catenulispora subtropica]|uniref:Uncharacterized protein n=1 Tax=Catenulispora subtropica TaxID=450798 RepID=A0ABN2T743_9ACTN